MVRRKASEQERPDSTRPASAAPRGWRGAGARWLALGALALVTLSGVAIWLVPRSHGRSPRQELGARDGVAYARDEACRQCHETQSRAWSGSHHDWAMKPASAATVRGDFDGATITHHGVTSRFFRRGDRFFVKTEGPDGRMADYRIAYTFGYEPLQQYLVEFPGGRLQSLTIAWDTRARRWVHLYPAERIGPGDPLHWTGRYQTWNLMCADCHSTNLRRNYDAETDSYRTTWAEINVGCQACHGPGGPHVEWARTAGLASRPDGGSRPAAATTLAVDFRSGGSPLEVESCVPCHARRHRVAAEGAPARSYMDTWVTAPLRPGLYHPDGQQRDEVYIHGSFLQSRMHERGVRCSDCHDPHSLRLRQEGNALCTTCHRPDPPLRFPMPHPKEYDSPAHHFHAPGSDGARCVACHMPATTYMVVDPRRDHSFPVPRPDLTARIGTPNACTGCHVDRPARWAAETVARWYPSGRQGAPHPGEAFAAAWAGRAEAGAALASLAADQGRPAFVRASALQALRSYGAAGAAAAAPLLHDADPMVRLAAAAALERQAPAQRLEAVGPLLTDPVRAVRVEAARVLAGVPREHWNAEQRTAFEAALAEFRAAQRATADMPSSRFNLAVVAGALGERDEAERLYREAIALDGGFLPAWVNLATLYSATGRNRDAERVLLDAIQRFPREGELRYSLGLLLAEENRLHEAAEALGEAGELLPDRPRVRYNLGLALQRLGRASDAEVELRRAQDADPTSPDYAYALATFYLQRGRLQEALVHAERLAALTPGAPGPADLVRRIRQALDQPGASPHRGPGSAAPR